MSIESQIFDALKGLVANRVYPDFAPEAVARPYIVYQQVGGEAVNFLDPTAPSKKNGRWQISVWATSREQAATLARQIEDLLRLTVALQATVLGAPIASYDPDTKLKGTHQDFSFWFSS